MARRLVRTFVALTAIPLIITVLILGLVSREQIVWTAKTMEHINTTATKEAGEEFQNLGSRAIHQSNAQTQSISKSAIESVSDQITHTQADSLNASANDFAALTESSFGGAMRQSLDTQSRTLTTVHQQMARLFADTAHKTQEASKGNIDRALLDLNDELMQKDAQRLVLAVESHVQQAVMALTLTAQMPDFTDNNLGGQKAILDALVRRYPMFTVVTVLDSKGRETAMSAADRVVTSGDLGSHPDAAYFQTAMKDQNFILLEEKPKGSNPPILRIAVPVEVYHGKAAGALTARLSLAELWDILRSTRFGPKGYVYVLDKDSTPLIPPREEAKDVVESFGIVNSLGWEVVVRQPITQALMPSIRLQQQIESNTQQALTAMRSQIQHVEKNAAQNLQSDSRRISAATTQQMQSHSQQVFQRLQQATARQTQTQLAQMQQAMQEQAKQIETQSDRQMVQAADVASANAGQNIPPLMHKALLRADSRLVIVALLVTVIFCAIGCFMALLMAGRIVRPVVHLAEVTHSIAQGDLDRRVNENAPDEIGDLAAAFNTMAASLQKSRSDLSEAEVQLVQSAKLASLGTLSAGVAHELNQPIAIIRGLSQQLQQEPGLSEDVLADLDIIEGQTGRMTKIVKHLRTFCRAGGADFAPVDVNQVVHDCFLLVGQQLRTHNVTAELHLCEEAPPVMADANELEQVFLNLITNARDAMEGRPDATITIRSWVEGGRFVLEFRDNGTGVPDTVVGRIFDPFFTTKDPGKGTGLGLSISHTILKRHQGDIQVYNDHGAVFTITLPLAEVQEIPKAA